MRERKKIAKLWKDLAETQHNLADSEEHPKELDTKVYKAKEVIRDTHNQKVRYVARFQKLNKEPERFLPSSPVTNQEVLPRNSVLKG